MKIYLAARYPRRPEMEDIAKRLTSMGLEITSTWVYGTEDGLTRAQVALLDLADTARADTVMSFTESEGSCFPGGGRHVEFGYAIGTGKRCIVIGERENIFHYHPKVEVYPSLGAWLETVKVAA